MATTPIEAVIAAKYNNPDYPSVLDASDRYPAKDGSQITNISAGSITELNALLNTKEPARGVSLSGSIDVNSPQVFGLNDFGIGFTICNPDWTFASDLDFYESNSSGPNQVSVGFRSNGQIGLSFRDAGASLTTVYITPTVALVDEAITDLYINFDRDGLATLYTNGKPNGTISIAAFSTINVGSANANAANIIAPSSGPILLNSFYTLDSGLLTDDEVLKLHELGIATFAAKNTGINFTLIYTFEEGSGYQVRDLTGQYDGLLSESGFVWTNARRESDVREYNVDAFNGPTNLITTAQDIITDEQILDTTDFTTDAIGNITIARVGTNNNNITVLSDNAADTSIDIRVNLETI